MTLRVPKSCLQRTQELMEHQPVYLMQAILTWCVNCQLMAERIFATADDVAPEYPCAKEEAHAG